jgi:hypothetical protein
MAASSISFDIVQKPRGAVIAPRIEDEVHVGELQNILGALRDLPVQYLFPVKANHPYTINPTPDMLLMRQSFDCKHAMEWFGSSGPPAVVFMPDISLRVDDFYGLHIGMSLVAKLPDSDVTLTMSRAGVIEASVATPQVRALINSMHRGYSQSQEALEAYFTYLRELKMDCKM